MNRDIKTIKASEIKLYLSSINKNISNKTLKDYKSILNQIFDLAKFDEVIDKNPLHYIKNKRSYLPVINPFTPSEVNLILDTAKKMNYKFYLYLSVAFFTGMRTGEILALKFSNIDFEKRYIHVKSSRGKFGEDKPKTIGSIRDIPIIDELYPILKEYKEAKFYQTYLFLTQYNKPYTCSKSFTLYLWKPLLKKLNLEYRSLYYQAYFCY